MPVTSLWTGGVLAFRNETFEQVLMLAPVAFYDEFTYRLLNVTDTWRAVDVSVAGNTTPIMSTTMQNGAAILLMDATSEAQESGLDWSDVRLFRLSNLYGFEIVMSMSVLPTGLTIAVLGLAGNKNAVANTVAESAWFRVEAGGAVVVETDDTVNEQNAIATGVTLVAGTQVVLSCDMREPANVKFYINGAQVAGGTVFNMSQDTTLRLQPYMMLQKASGAGLGVAEIDSIKVFAKRSL